MKKLRIHKGGRKPKIKNEYDFGTPELIKKRMSISPSDPTMASCPLDALLARGHISPQAHSVAQLFRSYHHRVFGSPHPPAVDLTTITGRDIGGDAYRAEWAYRGACEMLLKRSRRHLAVIDAVVIHEHWPAWFLADRCSPQRGATLEAFGILLQWERELPSEAENRAA